MWALQYTLWVLCLWLLDLSSVPLSKNCGEKKIFHLEFISGSVGAPDSKGHKGRHVPVIEILPAHLHLHNTTTYMQHEAEKTVLQDNMKNMAVEGSLGLCNEQ